jgi:glycerate dehydrogenase
MSIVVLDGFTLNPGDLSWAPLEALGDCKIYDRTFPADLLERANQAAVLLTNKTVLSRGTIESLAALRYIGVLATGTNVVDLQAARERGVAVSNVPAYGTASVAQATIALLLELAQGVGHHSRAVRDGRWSQSPDFCFWDRPLIELAGLTLGTIGFGRIGQAVSTMATALGMNVQTCILRQKPLPPSIRQVGLDTLFRTSDVVSLHCPLTPQTHGMVDARRLALMKQSAFLLNTSRGQLVDETALAAALNSGRIAGAGLDVLSEEPPRADHPLINARNCVVTPHFAWGTRAARLRLMNVAAENVRAFREGRPQNLVT